MAQGAVKWNSSGAYRPTQTGEEAGFGDPAFYWLSEGRVVGRGGARITGWATEAGKSAEFDAAMRADNREVTRILHNNEQDKSGKPRWVLPDVAVHVICAGIPDRPEIRKADGQRMGIRYYFSDNREGRPTSHLHFRGVLHNSAWKKPVMFQVAAKTKTNAVLAILYDHYRALDVLDALRGSQHPYFMLALPFTVGELVDAKSKDRSVSSEVTPPASAIPEFVGRPLEDGDDNSGDEEAQRQVIEQEFIRDLWIGSQTAVNVCEAALEETLAWADMPPPAPKTDTTPEPENDAD